MKVAMLLGRGVTSSTIVEYYYFLSAILSIFR